MACKWIIHCLRDTYPKLWARFRWVFCQLEVLRDCLPPSVRRTLDGLPESLDKTYERILNEIKKPNRDHALRLLQCLVVAIRPLRAEELAEVLAVDFDDAEGVPKLNTNWRWEDQEQALLSSCSSLITIVKSDESRIVQFSHFSVKEFLTSARLATSSGDVSRFHVVLEPAHTILAQASISALLRLDVPIEEGDVENSYPLARYAAGHWVAHAKYEKVSSYLRKAMETLFDPHRPYYAAWLHLHDIDTPPVAGSIFNQFASAWKPESGAQSRATPLYYAALCGFQDLVEHLVVGNPNHVNARGGYYVLPLVAALAGSYFQTAKFLRDNGADPNVMSRNKNTPLHSAAYHGDFEMIQLLLKYEANVNARGANGQTPLHFVTSGPYMAGPNIDLSLSNIVRLLLEHGADPNAMDIDRFTPLHVAVQYGRVGAVRVLLEHSANVGSQAGDRTTIFHAASEFVNAREAKDRTALHLVSDFRHYAVTNVELSVSNVTRLLLEHGANINARDDTFFTPLHSAARYGRVEVARLLLEHGANVGAEDEDGRTASDVAVGGTRNEIMQLLSEYRAK
jgi:ankyrin repeat protein